RRGNSLHRGSNLRACFVVSLLCYDTFLEQRIGVSKRRLCELRRRLRALPVRLGCADVFTARSFCRFRLLSAGCLEHCVCLTLFRVDLGPLEFKQNGAGGDVVAFVHTKMSDASRDLA